jgi:hypothetical protein
MDDLENSSDASYTFSPDSIRTPRLPKAPTRTPSLSRPSRDPPKPKRPLPRCIQSKKRNKKTPENNSQTTSKLEIKPVSKNLKRRRQQGADIIDLTADYEEVIVTSV